MNVPNALSLFRLCLVPIFSWVYFGNSEVSRIYAVIIYAMASATDFLDGKIARKYNQISKLGRILDPLGDKMMTFAVLLCITISNVIPVWAIVVFLAKEIIMGIGGFILYKKFKDMPPANYMGKISTVVFFVVCVILMLFSGISETAATVMISIALAVMILALVGYTIRYIRIIKEIRRGRAQQ